MTTTTTMASARLAQGRHVGAPDSERVDLPAGTVTTAGASRLSPPRCTVELPMRLCLRDSLRWLEHARSTSTVPGARRVVPAQHPEHFLLEFPLRAVELASAATFGQTVDASGEILDDVAITRALEGHHVDLTGAEETELLRRMMAAGWTDERAAARLGVSKRTVLRRRREAAIASSRQLPSTVYAQGWSA